MKKHMLVSLVLLSVPAAQAANPLAIPWKTAGDGAFTTAANWNWSKNSYPGENVANGAGQQAVFNTLTVPYVATLPTGDVLLPFSVRFDLTDGGDATLAGPGTTWLTPQQAADYYASYAFRCHYAGNCFFRNEVSGTAPYLSARDFSVRQRAEAGLVRLDFAGAFNFYDPDGTARNNTYSLFEKGAADTTGVITFDGSTRFYQLSVFNGNGYEGFTTNKIVFAGGTHELTFLNVGNANKNGRERARVIEVTDGATLSVVNALTPARPDSGAAGDGFYLSVTDGGVFNGGFWDTATGAKGHAFATFDRGCWFKNNGSIQFGCAAGSTTTVSFAEGAYDNRGAMAVGYLGTDAAGVASCRFRLAATNSCFRFGFDSNNKTRINGDAKLSFVDCAVTNTSDFIIGETEIAACPEMSLVGGTLGGVSGVNSKLTVCASSSGRLALDGCDASAINCSVSVGGGNASNTRLTTAVTGTVDIAGGTVLTGLNRGLYVGRRTGSAGVVNLRDGTVLFQTLDLGEYGCGILNISGGSLTISRFLYFCQYASDEDSASEVNISKGVFATPAATLAKASGRKVVANLTGGEWRVTSIVGGAGTSTLRANGGRIVPTGETTTSAPLISGLSEMTLSGDGLTIDVSSYDAAINQTIGGTGPLLADGAHTLTLSSGMTMTASVGARGGATLDLNGVQPGGLVLGDAVARARLKVTVGSTVALTGAAVVRNVEIVPSAAFAKSATPYALFTTPVEPEAETVAAWGAAKTAEGMIPNDAVDDYQVVRRGSLWSFELTVRDPVVTALNVPDGETFTVSEPLGFGRKDWLVCSVGAGATLTVNAALTGGKLVKQGKGELVLSDVANVLYSGFELRDGRLVAHSAAALGGQPEAMSCLAGGTLVFASDYVQGDFTGTLSVDTERANGTNVVILCEKDVTLGFPKIEKGALLKRGAGTLTLTASESRTYDGGSQSNFEVLRNNSYVNRNRHLTFPADGSSPEIPPVGELAVVEGRLTVQGASPETEVRLCGNVVVGVPTEDALSAEPELVLNCVRLRLAGTFFFFACGLCESCSATEPLFTMTNCASLACSGFKGLSQTKNKNLKPQAVVDGSELALNNFYASDQNEAGSANYCTPTYIFRNGGRFGCNLVQSGPVVLNFDGGEWERDAGQTVSLNAKYAGAIEFGARGFVVSDGNVADFAGSTYTNAVLAGEGTVANVTLERPTLCVETDGAGGSVALTVADTVMLSARVFVDVRRTATNPLSVSDAPFRVATFADEVPDLSRWKLIGSGDRGVTARFSAVGHDVFATPCPMPGLLILIR